MKLLVSLFGKNVFVEGTSAGTKVDYSNYYAMPAECKNCNTTTRIYIKKGVHYNDIIEGVKCNYCNCRLEKRV